MLMITRIHLFKNSSYIYTDKLFREGRIPRTRYIDYYIPTMSSSQGSVSNYHLSTFYKDTNGIFYDEQIQWF